MKTFKLYTHIDWIKYSWESMNDSKFMEWEVRRCYYGDPHPPPGKDERVFYTDSELEHALNHECVQKIAFMLESRFVSPGFYNFLERNIEIFDKVLSHDDYILSTYPGRCIFYPHGNCVIKRKDFNIYEKSKLVSFISSLKRLNVSGHMLRHAIYDLYTNRNKNWTRLLLGNTKIDLYGKISGNYVEYKLDSLKDYMFQVVVENCILDTYFTEKIIDCFVTGTIPIYYGTNKIGKFFDDYGILRFSTLEELFQILGTLTPDLYFDRMEAIHKNFNLAQKYVIPEDWLYENTDVFS